MPLPRASYAAIQQELVEHGLEVSCCPHLSALAKRHGCGSGPDCVPCSIRLCPPTTPPLHADPRSVCIDTLASIYSQEQQYKVIKTHHVHKANMPQYAAR